MFISGEVATARAAAACNTIMVTACFWGSSGDVLVFRPYVDCYTCSYMSYRCFPSHQTAESRRLPPAAMPFAFISYMYVWCIGIDLFFSKLFFLLLPDFWNFSLCTLGVQEKGCFGNIGTAGWEFGIQGNCFDSWHACAWQAWSWYQKQVLQCLYLCRNLLKFSEIMFFYNS